MLGCLPTLAPVIEHVRGHYGVLQGQWVLLAMVLTHTAGRVDSTIVLMEK